MRGLCHSEDRSNKINQRFGISGASVTLFFCNFPSSVLERCCKLDCLEISKFTIGLVISILFILITKVRELHINGKDKLKTIYNSN